MFYEIFRPSSCGRETLQLPTAAAVDGILYALRWQANILFVAVGCYYPIITHCIFKYSNIRVYLVSLLIVSIYRKVFVQLTVRYFVVLCCSVVVFIIPKVHTRRWRRWC